MSKNKKYIIIAIIIILGICGILAVSINALNNNNDRIMQNITGEEQEKINAQIMENMLRYAQ